jgi:predicted secreted protein
VAANDVPTNIELRVGEKYTIELPGLGTSGYVWDHDLAGDDGVVDVQWTRGYPADSPSRPVGVSAPEVVTIRAERAGMVQVRLYQHRRWEPPERMRAEHRLSVLVGSP